ncbi:hypothetical protein B484DRAFT_470103 [Ochromonadaceae sp. CCMP2298]|nr:hypothetical protein B484DRAFT_470103 [Ochromonadaceae sp. CCMP2298]
MYNKAQATEGVRGSMDPGCFRRPTYESQYWFCKGKSTPSLILKVAYFELELSHNWTESSLRLGYFLPNERAEEVIQSGEQLTRQDWANGLLGAGETYGPWWGDVYRGAFQSMNNMISRGQHGRDYPHHYLEKTTNDALYYIYDAARNPGVKVTLPGRSVPCLPADLRPREWANALVSAFEVLLISYRKLEIFTNYTFYSKNQAKSPPTFKQKKPDVRIKPGPGAPPGPTKIKEGGGRGKKTDVERTAVKTPRGGGKVLLLTDGQGGPQGRGVCAKNMLSHYKATLKDGIVLKECEKDCKRLHVKDYPAHQQRQHVLNIAEKYCKPIMEDAAYLKLESDIKSDKRMK